ncbi:hypothetical protein ACQ4PT_063292 [Festuca glaucescens]
MAGGGLFGGAGAFWATRALEVVKRNDSPGLLWKRIKLTTTRKNNAKKRLKRLWQISTSWHVILWFIGNTFELEPRSENEAVIRACGQVESSSTSSTAAAAGKQQ